MIKNNKILYGIFTLFVGIALSFNTAIAQETNQDVMTNDSFIGKVVDATTNQPLPNVEVEIEGQTATTDQDGKFTFDNLDVESQRTQNQGVESQEGVENQEMASGELEIKINHEGYEELTETVSADELRKGAEHEQEQRTQQQEEQEFGQEQEEDIKTFKLQPEEY